MDFNNTLLRHIAMPPSPPLVVPYPCLCECTNAHVCLAHQCRHSCSPFKPWPTLFFFFWAHWLHTHAHMTMRWCTTMSTHTHAHVLQHTHTHAKPPTHWCTNTYYCHESTWGILAHSSWAPSTIKSSGAASPIMNFIAYALIAPDSFPVLPAPLLCLASEGPVYSNCKQ